MERINNSQLELFSESKDAGESRNATFNKTFLSHIWSYEKAILTIIAFVIISIISFSLGVEKGKKLTLMKNNGLFDLAATKEPTKEAPAQPMIKKEEPVQQPAFLGKQNFTIQLASYKSKSSAQKEAQALKKRGLAPIILSKGSYIVLCVGNFANKQAAGLILSEMKKRYSTCYVRRL